MHELPLVFFTVLAQASAGLMIAMMINQIGGEKALHNNLLFVSGLVSLIIVALSGGSAMLHLGQPLRAINALFGTGRSPLSNEIVGCGIYGGLLFISLVIMYWRPRMISAINLFRGLATLAAITLLMLIPKIYTLTTIPQWNTDYTAIQMILAAVTTGGALAMIWCPNRLNLCITTIGIVIGVAIFPGYMAFISHTAPQTLQQGMGFWNTKFALYAIGLVLAVFSYRKQTRSLAMTSGLILIVAELSGRIAFYDLWSISM